MDAERILAGEAERVKRVCEGCGLEISAVGHYPNHLDPDPERRREHAEYFLKLIDAASLLGAPVVCTFAGRDPARSIEDNIEDFKRHFEPLVERAAERGVKIAFENCPGGHNIAISPYAWELMFKAIDSPVVGLEFDPSHLVWQGIDYVKAVYEFGERIYHVHAKDTEIIRPELERKGIFGSGWWRYRIPGWGEVDWRRFVAALLDVGYEGNLDIEHEDPVFHGERFKEGLLLGLRFLSQFVV